MEVIRFFRCPKPLTKEEHERWFKNTYSKDIARFDFLVIDKTSNNAIGTVGVNHIDWEKHSCEISYMIAESAYQRKGYAVESIAAMMKAMMEEKVNIFFAEVHRENIASRKTIEKLKYIPYSEQLPFIIYCKWENTDVFHTR